MNKKTTWYRPNQHKNTLIVASVPHTGTFTTEAFLDLIGVNHVRIHMDIGLNDKQQRCIIPIRDPRNTWQSTYQRHYKEDNQQNICDQLLTMWGSLRNLHKDNPTILFTIDKPVKEGYWNELADFLNISHDRGSDSLITTHLQGKKYNQSAWKHPLGDIPEWVENERKYWGYE